MTLQNILMLFKILYLRLSRAKRYNVRETIDLYRCNLLFEMGKLSH